MKKILSVAALALGAGAIFIGASNALAYRGDINVKGPNYTPERHEAMTKAFEQNNYAAWKAQMVGRGRVTEVVNEQNFAKFSEMHKLQLEGKTVEANKIRTELGLGLHNGSGKGLGRGMGRNLNK